MAARALFSWAVKRGTIPSNPFERVPAAATARRDRVLSDDEIRAIWNATKGMGSFDAIVRSLLLTGQRREEVSGLTWGELDAGLSAWTLPAARSRQRALPSSGGRRPVPSALNNHAHPPLTEVRAEVVANSATFICFRLTAIVVNLGVIRSAILPN
jgi:integrase